MDSKHEKNNKPEQRLYTDVNLIVNYYGRHLDKREKEAMKCAIQKIIEKK